MNVNLARNRQLAHSKIQDLMRQGELDEAHYQAEEALTEFGPHLSLLCDKAACEYEIGYFSDCENTFELIESELTKAERLASVDSKRRTYIFLAKIAEEFGEYDKTLRFLTHAKALACTDEELAKIFMHELRVLAYLNYTQGLSILYNLVQNKNAAADTQSFETLRSLMWAEWRIMSFQHAEMRFREILSKKLSPSDFKTANRDFVEISVLAKRTREASAQAALQNLKTEDTPAYDDALLYISMGLPVRSGLRADVGVSKMMQLRVLMLGSAFEKDAKVRSDLQQQYLSIASTVSQNSQALLYKLLSVS